MADSAVKMVKAGCQYITVLGVDFMSENVRAILDQAGFSEVEAKFGYLLEALDMGAPPHGMAWFCEFKSLKAIEASMELMSIRPFQIQYPFRSKEKLHSSSM
ncbi:unnamed protein product [Camellia sinensis]